MTHSSSMTMNCEGAEILLYSQANKSICHSFTDACGRIQDHGTGRSLSQKVRTAAGCLSPDSHGDVERTMWSGACAVGCVTIGHVFWEHELS